MCIRDSGGGVQIVGANQQSLKFSQPGDQLVFFTLKTGSKTGKATIHLTANGGGQQTKETIEIEVRNPNPIVTLRNSQWAEAGQSKELSYNLSSSSANNQIKLEVSRDVYKRQVLEKTLLRSSLVSTALLMFRLNSIISQVNWKLFAKSLTLTALVQK